MKQHIVRLAKLYFGLFLYAVAIITNINSGTGLPPWDLFHTGFTYITPFTYGQVTVFFSILIVGLNTFWLKEKVGLGTLSNMLLVGIFADIINYMGFVPFNSGMFGYIQLFSGMLIMCFAMYFYIGAGYGIGPRDGFFIGLSKKFGMSTRMAKTATEVLVFAIGAALGAKVGIGTAVFALCIGPLMQFVFKKLKFDVGAVSHIYMDDMVKGIKNKELPDGQDSQ